MHTDLKQAVEVLRAGGVILYPTDTIWGLGCDASNAEAVKKIYDIKQRSDEKSMLILVNKPTMAQFYVEEIPDAAWDIMEVADTPTTIILDSAKNLAKNLIATDGSIGIRVTSEEFSHKLIERFKMPIVSTSANVSGEKAPAIFDEISDEIKSKVDYIVNFRQDDLTKTKSSSIIKISNNGLFKIIR